jgi:hypothetical protein
MRTLLLLPLAAAAIFFLVLNCPVPVALLDGYQDIEFQFVVVDVATNQPISDALIQLLDTEGTGMLEQDLITDKDGRARLIERCKMGAIVRGFRTKGSVCFPDRVLIVSREGYEPTMPRLLITWTGWSRDMDDQSPVSIRIGLRRPAN